MNTIARSVFALALSGTSLGAFAQTIQPYTAPVVKPYNPPTVQAYPAPIIQAEPAPRVQAEDATSTQSWNLGKATLDTSPGQKTAHFRGIYLTTGDCESLHCDAEPGMVGVIDQFSGVAPNYAMHKLTLVVIDAQKNLLEKRHIFVLSNGGYSAFVTGYNKPDGTYYFGVYTPDHPARLIADGSFTVSRGQGASQGPAALNDPQEQAARNDSQGQSAQHDRQGPVAQPVVGTWYGLGGGSTGSITLNADGTYTKDGQYGGHYVASGGHVHFDGVLSVWNGGNAVTTAAHALVFHWTENGYGVEMSYSR